MLIWVAVVEKGWANSSKCRNVKKIGNKIVKILTKLKRQNLFKFQIKNLSRFMKIWNTSSRKELNFLNINTKVTFTKLK